MLAIVEILVFLFGLVLLIGGKLRLSGKTILEGGKVRLTGGALVLLLLVLLYVNFMPQAAGQRVVPAPKPTMPSTPTITPTPGPVQPADLRSLCVSVTGAHTEGLDPVLRQLLQALQFQTLDPGGACDANLEIVLEGKPLSASYQVDNSAESQECFTGASFSGEFKLSAPNAIPLIAQINETSLPPNVIRDVCPAVDYAPYKDAWPAAVLKGMVEFFGDRAIAHSVQVSALREAAMTLVENGSYSDPKGMAQELIVFLDNTDPATRASAARMLAAMRPVPAEALPALVQHLVTEKDNTYGVKDQLWSALHNAGPQAAAILPEVINILWDGEASYDRSQAADVIGAIGPQAQPATEALLAALKDPDAWLRMMAARALGNIRAAPRDSVPPLIAALGDPEENVRRAAELSLHEITGIPEGLFGEDAKAWEEWWKIQPK